MIICEFCVQLERDGNCGLGLKKPNRMSCREFDPGMAKFCANPTDFVGARQIIEMAMFFGIKGIELRKIKLIATEEEQTRSRALV